MSDLIERQVAKNAICNACGKIDCDQMDTCEMLKLPPAQPDFDITVKIDKAYDDGYEAGYLQGRHDWGDLDG